MRVPEAVAALEAKWRGYWEEHQCFRAPDVPLGEKFFNFDSGPFVNGELHLGHVRTYVLGDVVARYQRLLGKAVLYATEWDAFGIPNEVGARAAGVSPVEYVRDNIARMRHTLQRLGVSYDWSRVHATCDPSYYRWTQWLFLQLHGRGLAYRAASHSAWCSRCCTTIAAFQVKEGRCGRCHSLVHFRETLKWYVATSKLERRLRDRVDDLSNWSPTAKRLLGRGAASQGSGVDGGDDWLVSRQCPWGTPIPIVYCQRCGVVAEHRLPVVLPSEIDWRLGPYALHQCAGFRSVSCPRCSGPAERETDTLDCFFDDSWSYMSSIADLRSAIEFPGNTLGAWLPVDHFHSGFDTFEYLNLYRFIGASHAEGAGQGWCEPINRYHGHEMVTSGGSKISKSAGNAQPADELLARHGADTLRLAVLWAARPERAVDAAHLDFNRAERFLRDVQRLITLVQRSAGDGRQPARGGLRRTVTRSRAVDWRKIADFVEFYRPNAAIEELATLLRRALEPSSTGAPCCSGDEVRVFGHTFAVALSPFAPFIAEELASVSGQAPLASLGRWPCD